MLQFVISYSTVRTILLAVLQKVVSKSECNLTHNPKQVRLHTQMFCCRLTSFHCTIQWHKIQSISTNKIKLYSYVYYLNTSPVIWVHVMIMQMIEEIFTFFTCYSLDQKICRLFLFELIFFYLHHRCVQCPCVNSKYSSFFPLIWVFKISTIGVPDKMLKF